MSVKAEPLDIVSLFERKLLSSPGGYGVLKIVLFGSHAKGTAQPESDIDVLVVAGRESESREAVADAAFEAQMRHAAAIEPVVMSVDELFPVTSYFVKNALETGKEVFTVSDVELRDQERRNLIDLGDEYLAGADAVFTQGIWRLAADTAYNAAELAVKALILKHDSDLPGSHGGVVGRFGELFVTTGKYDRLLGRRLNHALEKRNRARYRIDADIRREDAETVRALARELLEIARLELTG